MFGGDSILMARFGCGFVGFRPGDGEPPLVGGNGMRASREGFLVSFDLFLPVNPDKLCLFNASILSGDVRVFLSLVFSLIKL